MRLILRLPASKESVPWALGRVLEWAAALGAGRSLRHRLRTAVGEALANAVVHGSGEDRQRTVTVSADFAHPGIRIAVRDAGPGFELAGAPGPARPESIERPGGRGLFLMRALADEVRLRRAAGCEVVLRFRITDPPGGEGASVPSGPDRAHGRPH